jgi:hypothetical protein
LSGWGIVAVSHANSSSHLHVDPHGGRSVLLALFRPFCGVQARPIRGGGGRFFFKAPTGGAGGPGSRTGRLLFLALLLPIGAAWFHRGFLRAPRGTLFFLSLVSPIPGFTPRTKSAQIHFDCIRYYWVVGGGVLAVVSWGFVGFSGWWSVVGGFLAFGFLMVLT